MNATQDTTETSIFEDGYDREVLEDNWRFFCNKTMKSILFIAAIFLGVDFFAFMAANLLDSSTVLYVIVAPVIYVGLGFLARHRPMPAISIAILLYLAILGYNVYLYGPMSLIAGWLIKAAIIFFLISGFQNAKEAEEARKKLELFR